MSACEGCGGGDALDTFEPKLRIAPDAVDVGAWPLGATGSAGFSIINDGNAPIELTGPVEIRGSEALSLAEAGAFPVAGGAFTEVTVRFTPREIGVVEGSVVLPLAPPLALVEVPVRAEGLPADVELSPAELDLGAVSAGESATGSITLRSLSDAPLEVELAVVGEAFRVAPPGEEPAIRFEISLGPLEERTLDVVFSPAGGGPYEARLVAELCGAGCGPTALLVGTGLAPRIGVAPRPIDVGEVAAGAVGEQEVIVENRGVGTLTVLGMALGDPGGQLELVAPELPVHLGEGEELALEVRFLAGAPVAAYEGTLLVDSNDPLSPRVQVPIRATTPGASLRVIPSAAHYGHLEPGSPRTLDVVALSAGTAPVTLEALEIEGDDPDAFELLTPPPTLPYTLSPGESLLLSVEARPEAEHADVGGASAVLVLTPTEGAPAEAALTFATGDEGCQPRVASTNLNLGSVRVGQGIAGALVVMNEGTATCTLRDAAPAPGLAFDPGFRFRTDGLTELAPGAQGTVSFGYEANVSGAASAFVRLRYHEQPEPLLVSASARGVLGNLVAEPPLLSFGPLVEQCGGDPQAVSFVNDGAENVTVTSVSLLPANAPFSLSPVSTPRNVSPGDLLEVVVTPDAGQAGVFAASLVVDTEEVGPVTAQLQLEVVADGEDVSETFQVADANSQVDILFVVDNSGSMADDQDTLAANFANFIAGANLAGTETIDFHIAVTSTDVLLPGALKGAFRGPPAVLRPSTGALEQTFADHVRLGAGGGGIELGLEAMRLALSEPLISSTNAGFLRTDAALSIIVVSDEDDSGDIDLTGIYETDTRSVQGYVSFLQGVKGGALSNAPTLFSVVGVGGPRYREMVQAFGGVELSITNPDWGEQLAEIGEVTFALQRTFRLADRPAPSSVVVEVDGQPTTAFVVLPEVPAVVLDVAPEPGSTVTITYRPDCGP